MDWFYLLWTVLFAGSVSCQQLTTVPPRDDDACMRNEVTFNCTVRGSQTLTDLVLAWSSPAYIGQGDPLRFTSDSENMPGMNMSSMINGNVTAVLISNTMIGGVPELVSELHVVGASQTSVITCSSESNQTSVTTSFITSVFPGRPQNGEARERSAGSCDFQVTWDPPTNIDILDIGRYMYVIYVPSRNMMNISLSATIGLTIPNCRVGNNSIQVAAMNPLGCIGPNSSLIQLSLLEMKDVISSSGLSAGAIAGIAVVCVVAFIIVVTVVTVAISCYVWKVEKQKCKNDEALELQNQELLQREDTLKKAFVQDKFGSYLALLYETLKRNIPSSMQAVIHELLDLMERKMSSNDIEKALKKLLETRVTSARGIRFAVRRLKTMIPQVIFTFDKELEEVGSSITMDQLSKLKDTDNHKEPRDELIRLVNQASPEKVKDLLQQFFEAVRDYEAENELMQAFAKFGETFASCKMPPKEIKRILEDTTNKLKVNEDVDSPYRGGARASSLRKVHGSTGTKPKKPKKGSTNKEPIPWMDLEVHGP